ncbi:MAG: hypothetical protein M3R36_17300 [Bacteroidota bacterium]|nr:hypothetical protein [Bacteroidota bacterium]
MDTQFKRLFFYSAGFIFVIALTINLQKSINSKSLENIKSSMDFDDIINQNADDMMKSGRQIFRYDTFGSEDFWGGKLNLHLAILGSKEGGVGDGISPKTALSLGLKVDMDKLPEAVVEGIKEGKVNLDDPATTIALLKADAVIGIKGIFNESGKMESVGIMCAFCHSTVDDAFSPGIGHRLDGYANRDIDVGKIISAAPDVKVIADILGVDLETTKKVLLSWGPGKFDAALMLDGKGFRPDGKTAATLMPAAYGLAGVNLHTYTGWGQVTNWNAFVSNLEMQGKGTYIDSRLNNPEKFPIAVKMGFFNKRDAVDLTSSKMAPLQFYQLSIPAPRPPEGSFNKNLASQGESLFNNKAKCISCHVPPLFTEPGWNMHKPEEIGIDDFQSSRSPDGMYRTTPLKGLWARQKGGFYHDGRFGALIDVVNHYNDFMNLQLTEDEKKDLVEYLKSL